MRIGTAVNIGLSFALGAIANAVAPEKFWTIYVGWAAGAFVAYLVMAIHAAQDAAEKR